MHSQTLLARIVRRSVAWYFRRSGWRVTGVPPEPRRCVIIAAPHTSNWDFIFFLGAAQELGIEPSFMGKKSLFRWPIGGLMRDLGGVPIDRASAQNSVEQMVAEFERRDELMLAIAPEGTRGAVAQWKSGFYHIALGAKVPLCCASMDYPKKLVRLAPPFMPSGDYDRDRAVIRSFYADCTPRHPEKGSLP